MNERLLGADPITIVDNAECDLFTLSRRISGKKIDPEWIIIFFQMMTRLYENSQISEIKIFLASVAGLGRHNSEPYDPKHHRRSHEITGSTSDPLVYVQDILKQFDVLIKSLQEESNPSPKEIQKMNKTALILYEVCYRFSREYNRHKNTTIEGIARSPVLYVKPADSLAYA